MVSTRASHAESVSSPPTEVTNFLLKFVTRCIFSSDLVHSEAHISGTMAAIAMKFETQLDNGLLLRLVALFST